MICSSCKKQKESLKQRQSKLVPGMIWNLCQTCADNNFEPRYMVILYGKQVGLDNKDIKRVLDQHLYVGDPILAKEIGSPN
jgi:hypothetical protein